MMRPGQGITGTIRPSRPPSRRRPQRPSRHRLRHRPQRPSRLRHQPRLRHPSQLRLRPLLQRLSRLRPPLRPQRPSRRRLRPRLRTSARSATLMAAVVRLLRATSPSNPGGDGTDNYVLKNANGQANNLAVRVSDSAPRIRSGSAFLRCSRKWKKSKKAGPPQKLRSYGGRSDTRSYPPPPPLLPPR